MRDRFFQFVPASPGAVAGTVVRCGLSQLQKGIKRQGKAQNGEQTVDDVGESPAADACKRLLA